MKQKYSFFRFLFLSVLLLNSHLLLQAQGVGISDASSTPDGSALLDISSTSKGILIPRVALTATNSAGPISSPATGLFVYNTATTSAGTVYDVSPGYYYNAGTSSSPNWVQVVNATGTGTNPTWEDVRVSLNTRYSGNTQPGLSGFAGSASLLAYTFGGGSQMQEIFFEIQLPHLWAEGTSIKPHVHWSPSDANSGNVTWYLEYTWANYGSVFPSSTTINATQAAAGTAFTSQIAGFSDITATGKKISSMIMCRLYRDPSQASDTYNSNAFLLGFDIHIQISSLGSRLEYIK